MDLIQFEFASSQLPIIVVQAQTGRPESSVSVVLDTGASAPFDVFISEDLAKRLKLTLEKELVPNVSSAVGSDRVGYSATRLPQFSIGRVQVANAEAAVTPVVARLAKDIGRRVDGIIGQHFLRSRIISIDYVRRTFDLAAQSGNPSKAMRFAMAPQRPIILVSARINGKGPFVMEIDTGATGSALSPEAARIAGVKMSGNVTVSGAGGKVAANIGHATIAFGSVRKKKQQVTVSESFAKLASTSGTPVDGILGAAFFLGTRLTIDYPGKRLWIETPRQQR
jgi:predicted aspartyl protease